MISKGRTSAILSSIFISNTSKVINPSGHLRIHKLNKKYSLVISTFDRRKILHLFSMINSAPVRIRLMIWFDYCCQSSRNCLWRGLAFSSFKSEHKALRVLADLCCSKYITVIYITFNLKKTHIMLRSSKRTK